MSATNPYTGMALFKVLTPSGSDLHLQTSEESDWYENNKRMYLTHNKFTNVSDLQELDRLLMLEVMVYRWSQWLTQGFDYQTSTVEPGTLQKNIGEYSKEIRQVKVALGIDRATREKDKGETLAEYINKLVQRGKEFGYHRNDQYETAVTKIYELKSMVQTFDRCDEDERKELDLSEGSILQWIRDQMIAEWDETEAEFRKNQAIWVRDL